MQTTRPTIETPPQQAISAAVRRSSAAPVFKPEFARSLRMHPLAAGAVALVVFVAIVAYALSRKPMYEAEALVYVEPAASKVLDDGTGGLFDSNKYDSYLQQEIQTSERLDILQAAVHVLPVGVWRGRGESEQQAALRLQQSLKVERVLNSYQLSFTLKGPTAEGTADALNAVIAAFLDAGRKDTLSTAGLRVQILTEEKNRIASELTAARAEQASLSSSLGMANPGLDAENPYDSQLAGLRTQLAEARAAHDVAAAQLASVSGSDTTRMHGLTAAADESIAGDSGLSSMKATISQRRAVLSGQMAGLTPENPIYKQDQTEISELDRTLSAMTSDMRDKAERRLQDKLRTDLARTGDVEARLNGELASQTFAATSASPKLQRAAELTADIQRLMKRYATVDDSLSSLALETSGPGMAHLALAAAPPVYPIPSRRKLMLLAALPLALLIGAFAAVFLRKRDPHVYSERDVEDLLGFTPMAVLPAAGGVSSAVMDEYVLRFAGGIESALRTGGARSFVFTPAGTSVGLESLLLPLAARLGQLGLDVVNVSAGAVMALPQGERVARRSEGQGSLVDARLDKLKQEHDLIFVEAPALLASAETEYLVRSADATILIATSGVTRRADLLQAALLLERLGVRGVGAVLEGLEPRFADSSFRTALADVERRQSLGSPSVGVFPQESAAPALEQEPEALTSTREGQENVDERLEIPVASQPAGEMMEPPTQGFAAVTDQQSEPELASGQATEEKLPMAMQFLKFEQPEAQPEKAIRPELTATELSETGQHVQAAPAPAQTMHRRAPARRVQPELPPPRNWFQKLFQRDAEPVVSIVPDADDEDDNAQYAQAEPPSVPTAPPLRFSVDDLDTPPRTGSAVLAAPIEMAPFTHEAAEPMDVPSTPEVYLQDTASEPVASASAHASAPAAVIADPWPGHPEAPLAWQQHPVETSEATANPQARVEPAAAAVQMPEASPLQPAADTREIPSPDLEDASADEPQPMPLQTTPAAELVPAAMAPVQEAATAAAPAWPEAALPAPLPEPMHSAEPAGWEHAAAAVSEAASEEIWQSATHPAPFAVEPLPPAQVTPEPFRTGRWEAARTVTRPETTPWRDRRVSGPNAIYRAPERRFNWNTAAAKPLSVMPHATSQTNAQKPVAIAGQPGSTTQPGTAATLLDRSSANLQEGSAQPARLTRKWGLLSRFDNPQESTETGRETERNAEPHTSQRSYRRG